MGGVFDGNGPVNTKLQLTVTLVDVDETTGRLLPHVFELPASVLPAGGVIVIALAFGCTVAPGVVVVVTAVRVIFRPISVGWGEAGLGESSDVAVSTVLVVGWMMVVEILAAPPFAAVLLELEFPRSLPYVAVITYGPPTASERLGMKLAVPMPVLLPVGTIETGLPDATPFTKNCTFPERVPEPKQAPPDVAEMHTLAI